MPAGRPPLPPEEVKVPINVRLRPDLFDKLDAMAEREGATRTAMVEKLIELAPMPKKKR